MSRSQPPLRPRFVSLCTLLALVCARASWAQCTAAPTFQPPVAYAAAPGLPIVSLVPADLDGDGDLDLVACAGPQILVLENQGAGVILPHAAVIAPVNLVDVVAGDFDSDGLPDLAAVGTIAGSGPGPGVQARVVTFHNATALGAFAFGPPVTIPYGPQGTSGSVGRAVRAADLDADGILDLVAVDSNGSSVWVLKGQGVLGLGDGTFGTPMPYPVLGSLHQDVAIGDFDQNGALDLAVVPYGGCNCPTQVTLLAGVLDAAGFPTGTFAPAGSVLVPGPSECENIHAADLDGDGLLDLAISSYLTVEVAWGTGGFGFTPQTCPLGAYPAQLAIGDFSADGRADVAAIRALPTGAGAANLTVLVGQTGNVFAGYDYPLDPSLARSVCAGDFDGDGRLDIAAGHANGIVDVCRGTCGAVTPQISLSWPNGGEIVVAGLATSVGWWKTGPIAFVDLDASHDGGITWERVATAVSGSSASWIPAAPGTSHALLRVSASGIPSIADACDLPFTILAPGVASSTSLGSGCGPLLSAPTLAIGAPILGQPAAIAVQGAAAWAAAMLFVSPVPGAPTPLSAGCTAWLDLGAAATVASFVTGAAGDWTSAQPVAAVNSLAGSVVRAQAVVLLPAAAFQLTNGVELVLGF
jgi:FG-GAP-like repeat